MTTTYPKLVYTWKYKPKSILLSKEIPKLDGFDITVTDDSIIAEVFNATGTEGYAKKILTYVERYFRAGMIVHSLKYSIDKNHSTDAFGKDGNRIPAFFIDKEENISIIDHTATLSFIDGKDIPGLITNEKLLGDIFIKYYDYHDKIIKHISESFQSFLKDSGKCLIYLWDILDAMRQFYKTNKYPIFYKQNNPVQSNENENINLLSTYDGKTREKKINRIAMKKNTDVCIHLGINEKDSIRLGKIINEYPYLEGRHIGINYNQLIHLPAEEKKWAVDTIRTAILNFVQDPFVVNTLGSKC